MTAHQGPLHGDGGSGNLGWGQLGDMRQDGHRRAGAEGKSLAVLGAKGQNGSKSPERLESH